MDRLKYYKYFSIKRKLLAQLSSILPPPVQMGFFVLLLGNVLPPLGGIVFQVFQFHISQKLVEDHRCVFLTRHTDTKSWSNKRCKQGPLYLQCLITSSAKDIHAISSANVLMFPLLFWGLWHSEVSHQAPEMSRVSRASVQVLLRWL